MSRKLEMAEELIKEARENFQKMPELFKRQAGPVMLPLLAAIETLKEAVREGGNYGGN